MTSQHQAPVRHSHLASPYPTTATEGTSNRDHAVVYYASHVMLVHIGQPPGRRDVAESVYKVIELVGTSTQSWELAAKAAVERARRPCGTCALRRLLSKIW